MRKSFAFLCAACFGITAGLFCGNSFAVTTVTDCTMEPCFLKGQRVLVSCQPETDDILQRGEVVLFENHFYHETGENSMMMKRIIGLPGEEIRLDCGSVYVDGELLNDNWTDIYRKGTASMDAKVVPAGNYFVLGDNRRESTDSRDETVGMVRKDEIIGKVIRQW